MNDDMNRILNKLDKLDDKLNSQNETLIRNTVTLEEHVKRTNMLEGKMSKVEDHVDKVESFIDKVKGSWKLILIISVLVGITAGIIKII